MTFASPSLLLALLAVPATLWFVVMLNRRGARAPSPSRTSTCSRRSSSGRASGGAGCRSGSSCSRSPRPRPRGRAAGAPHGPEENATIVLLVDVSGSMRANDVDAFAARGGGERDATLRRQAAEADQRRPRLLQLHRRRARQAGRRPRRDRRTGSLPRTGGADGAQRRHRRGDEADRALAGGEGRLPRRRAARCRRRSCSSRTGPRTAARSRPSRRRATRRPPASGSTASRSARRRGSSTPTTARTADLPVPPDPGTVRAIAQITGGRAYTARPLGPPRRGLPRPRLEHRPEGRAPRDHLLVRGRLRAAPARAASAISRLWSAPCPRDPGRAREAPRRPPR